MNSEYMGILAFLIFVGGILCLSTYFLYDLNKKSEKKS